MILLSLEMPTVVLPDWTPLTDLDFVLAHKVLQDQQYAAFFAARPEGRELILDNSVHELGHPLPMTDLLQAASTVQADYVIPPDKLGEYRQNLEWYEEAEDVLGGLFSLAPVLCGSTALERAEFLDRVTSASMLCLPFREPRLEWFREQRGAILGLFRRIHLLGVNTLEELEEFAEEEARSPKGTVWSVDTTKPVKFGLRKQLMDVSLDLRTFGAYTAGGGNANARNLLDVIEIDESQDASVRFNIAWFSALLRGAGQPR